MSHQSNHANAATCENPRVDRKPTDSFRRKIDELDLGPVMFKLASSKDGAGWSVERVLRVEGEYRKFLILCAEMPGEPIVPSKDVDEMWHTHILDTAKYANDCASIFGYFLHHFPYLGVRSDEDAAVLLKAFKRTKTLYNDRFGRLTTSNPTCAKPEGLPTLKPADCMTGCGSVVCSPSSCTNNHVPNGSIDFTSRPTFEAARAA